MQAITCPLTGKPGQVSRVKEASELFSLYESYFGSSLPARLKSKYFTDAITEYECADSGLRWYQPAKLGDSEFYSSLAETFPWYYSGETWDKGAALSLIQKKNCGHILEIGCGKGKFLKQLRDLGLTCTGLDINTSAIAEARSLGLSAYTDTDELPKDTKYSTLCLFQTIEHVNDPANFLRNFTSKFNPDRIILSAPCHQSLLGYTNDPLSWPPHHATAWSEKAFSILAQSVGYTLVEVDYEELGYTHFNNILNKHNRRLFGLPRIPQGRLGWWLFRLARKTKKYWATRSHSILVLLERSR